MKKLLMLSKLIMIYYFNNIKTKIKHTFNIYMNVEITIQFAIGLVQPLIRTELN